MVDQALRTVAIRPRAAVRDAWKVGSTAPGNWPLEPNHPVSLAGK